jgi:hypothetical protein
MQSTIMQDAVGVCASCGKPFPRTSTQGLYCSLRCRDRAKRQRRTARDGNHTLPSTSPYWAVLTSPTLEELNTYVQAYLDAPDNGQTLYINHKPTGFVLPPGLRDNEYNEIYQIGRK